MNKWMSSRCTTLAVLMVAAGAVNAQQSTERYIPIGKSPGVSSEESFIGMITEIDYADHKMEITGTDGKMSAAPTDSTRYFLDRTKRKKSNQTATFRDCEVGVKVEIKTNADGSIDWIKIEG